MLRHLLSCFFLLLLIFSACSEATNSTSSQVAPLSGQARMLHLLDSIASFSNPMDNYAMNSARARYWEQEIAKGGNVSEQASKQFKFALELLNAGKTEQAVVEFSKLIQGLEQNGIGLNDQTRLIYEFQALAYLRMGEEQNCLRQPNAASCILPLGPEGVHVYKKGSETAIQLLSQLLETYPNDPQSLWLLNFAHMTVGTFPDGVPTQWRIPATYFNPSNQLDKFQNVAPQMGVAVTGLSGSTCVEDFNNDGLLDIFATSYGLRDQCHLFINQGDHFVDQTKLAGLEGQFGGLNTLHADYNNDGFTDLFILRGAWFQKGGAIPNSLLRNNGDGTFTDVTIEAGLLSFHPTQTAVWADFNNDGWLDLFIGNESTETEGQFLHHPCEFYLNQGDGTFREMAAEVGLNLEAWVKGVAAGDINNDGLPDLYLSIPGKPNLLFLNTGDLKFQEIAAQAGVQEPILSFPTWFFDYDNDGYLDLFVGSYEMRKIGLAGAEQLQEILSGTGDPLGSPRLYHNQGDGTFTDQSKAAGLDKTMFAMGANFGDINNDGYLDFYIGTGTPDLRATVPNRMFLNQGGKSFVEVTMNGFAHIQKGHGIGFGDFDNDGDEDIYCVMGGAYEGDLAQNVLFANPTQNKHWLTLKLVGKKANRSAFGATIKIECTTEQGRSRTIYRTVSTGGSFGANSLQQEIGLGDARKINRLEITWPGQTQPEVFTEVPIDRFIQIEEGRGSLSFPDRPSARLPI